MRSRLRRGATRSFPEWKPSLARTVKGARTLARRSDPAQIMGYTSLADRLFPAFAALGTASRRVYHITEAQALKPCAHQ